MTRYERLVRFFRPLMRFFFPCRVLDLPESLPQGGVIFAANHISFFDPVFFAILLPRPLTFMGKEELTRRPIIGKWVRECGMIPLSRDGGDAAKLRQAVRALKEGKAFSIFPQGKRCRYPLKEEDFKAGVGMMATLSGAEIIPVGIYSKNYRVRPFRKTYLQFGSPLPLSAPEQMGKKEQSLYISHLIFEEIRRLEEMARQAAKR